MRKNCIFTAILPKTTFWRRFPAISLNKTIMNYTVQNYISIYNIFTVKYKP